jgi:hypothetical protein
MSVLNATIDARKTGVLYMHRAQLAATLDLDGAFNDVTFRLLHGAVEATSSTASSSCYAPTAGSVW